MIFPDQLKAMPQWLCWRFINKPGAKKPSKVPHYATTGELRMGVQGGESDRANLVDYAAALAAMEARDHDGIGFAFLPGDGLIGIDLDACFGTEDKEREERARSIIMACNSWTEASPSGRGVHIIVRGETSTFKSNELGIEVFCGSQFFTMTGHHVEGMPEEIATISSELLAKLRRTVKGVEAVRVATPAPAMSSASKVESALAMISPDAGYEAWLRIGMAIHAELGAGAMSVWDHWSSRGATYKGGKDIESHWRSFKPGAITGATLFKMAMDNGWRVPAQPRQAPTPTPTPIETVDPDTGEISYEHEVVWLEDQPAQEWAQPLDVFGVAPPPVMPLDVIPAELLDYVQDQADLTGCDHSIIAMAALVAAAACITDGIRLQPKRLDPTWTESCRLWVAFVGDPSTKKSPAISKAVRHIKRLDHAMADSNASAYADFKTQHDGWKDAKKLDKSIPEPKQPPQHRLVVEDITVEALTEVLKDNPRGVLTLKDELTGWFASMDAYKGGSKGASMDRAHWLEAYNGGRHTVDRVTRGQVVVPNWSTCIIGGIQPDMMRKVANSMGNDGLLQRFIVIVAKPAVMDVDRVPDMDAMRRFGALFDNLASLTPGNDSVTLTEPAHQSRERVALMAKKMIDAFDNPHMRAWLGKWDGLFARLLLTYHVIECSTRGVYPTQERVSGETAAKVERLLVGTLLHHAIHFYSEVLDASDRQEHQRQLARFILAKRFTRLTKRDLMRGWRATRSMEWYELRGIVDGLCSMAWLEADAADLDTDGKPKSWRVNPKVHDMFTGHATREVERRKLAAEAIREAKEAYKAV